MKYSTTSILAIALLASLGSIHASSGFKISARSKPQVAKTEEEARRQIAAIQDYARATGLRPSGPPPPRQSTIPTPPTPSRGSTPLTGGKGGPTPSGGKGRPPQRDLTEEEPLPPPDESEIEVLRKLIDILETGKRGNLSVDEAALAKYKKQLSELEGQEEEEEEEEETETEKRERLRIEERNRETKEKETEKEAEESQGTEETEGGAGGTGIDEGAPQAPPLETETGKQAKPAKLTKKKK